MPNALQECLSEKNRVTETVNFNSQLEQIYQKTSKNTNKKLVIDESVDYPSLDHLPNWLSLAKEIQIISPESFE